MAVKPIIFSLAFCVNFLFCVPYTITHERACTHTHALSQTFDLSSLFACHCAKTKKKYEYIHIHAHKSMFYLMHRMLPWTRLQVAWVSLLFVHHVQRKLWQIDVFFHNPPSSINSNMYLAHVHERELLFDAIPKDQHRILEIEVLSWFVQYSI